MKKYKKFLKSFTLIELIIVIWIILILAVAAVIGLSNWMRKARDARKIADINSLSKAILIYEITDGWFPLPSKAINITDQKWTIIWKQWLFDTEIFKVVSSLTKVVKDPTANNYYTYTRYDNNKWFEIGTFLDEFEPYSNFLSQKAFAEDWVTDPYVFVYWKLNFCDENWNVLFPKPLTIYDANKPEYVNQRNMWEFGKVMLNLNFLQWSEDKEQTGTWECSRAIQAPVIWYDSYTTWLNISQASNLNFNYSTGGLNEILQSACPNFWLCNAPDIYKINYNYQLLTYTKPDKSLVILETLYNPTIWKYEIINNEIVLSWAWYTSIDSGKVFDVKVNLASDYIIYYTWKEWDLYSYSSQTGSSTKFSSWGSWASSWWWTSWGWFSFAGKDWTVSTISFSNKTVWTYSKWWNVYFYSIPSSSNSSAINITELPFDGKTPQIFNINDNNYVIIYEWLDWKIYTNKLEIDSSGNISSNIQLDSWTLNQIVTQEWCMKNLRLLQVWNNVFLLAFENTAWLTKVASLILDNEWFTYVNLLTVDSSVISDFNFTTTWWWYVNLTYTKSWNWNLKVIYVDELWNITLEDTKTIAWSDYSVSNILPWVVSVVTSDWTYQDYNLDWIKTNVVWTEPIDEEEEEEVVDPVLPWVITYVRKNRLSTISRGTCILKDNWDSYCWWWTEGTITHNWYWISWWDYWGCIWGNPSNSWRCLWDTSSSTRNALYGYTDSNFDIAEIDAWRSSSCLMTTAGKLVCKWRNEYWQLWIWWKVWDNYKLLPVVWISTWAIDVSVGNRHACAVMLGWTVKCWWYWYWYSPVDKTGLSETIKSVSAWRDFTCVLTTSWWVKCWWVNSYWQLWNWTTTSNYTAVDVIWLTSWVKLISSWEYHSCALLENDTVKCWWKSNSIWTDEVVVAWNPVQVKWLPSWIRDLSVWWRHSCVLSNIWEIYCWWSNSNRQIMWVIDWVSPLGSYLLPVKVPLPTTVPFTWLDF